MSNAFVGLACQCWEICSSPGELCLLKLTSEAQTAGKDGKRFKQDDERVDELMERYREDLAEEVGFSHTCALHRYSELTSKMSTTGRDR